MSKSIVLISDPGAATFVENISSWVSKNGKFFGDDEHLARWAGCTHIFCDTCEKPIIKQSYTICSDCREKAAVERYEALPKTEWNGTTPLYSELLGEYFFDEDDLICTDCNCNTEDMRLFLCDAVPFSEIEPESYLDDMPDDSELPSELLDAIKEFNRAISHLSPAYWVPSTTAVKITEDDK